MIASRSLSSSSSSSKLVAALRGLATNHNIHRHCFAINHLAACNSNINSRSFSTSTLMSHNAWFRIQCKSPTSLFASYSTDTKNSAEDAEGEEKCEEFAPDETESGTKNDTKNLIENSEQYTALQDKLLRIYAEMDNMRKRHSLAIERTQKYGMEPLAKSLCVIIDDLDRSLSAAAANSDSSSDPESTKMPDYKSLYQALLDSVKMLRKTLIQDVLKRNNIDLICPEQGHDFDVTLHNAIGTDKVTEGAKINTISKVELKGMLLHSKLIRAAMVRVFQ
ncbi:MAG: hypothetical protein MHMPM18_001870 [Marteilia pararefringens]